MRQTVWRPLENADAVRTERLPKRELELHQLAEALRSAESSAHHVPLPPFKEGRADNPLVRIPLERAWPIPAIAQRVAGHFQSIIFAAPNIWQMEPTVYRAARALGVPLAAGVAYNPPVTLEMAKQLSRALVALSAEQMGEFLTAQAQAHSPAAPFLVWISHAVNGARTNPLLANGSSMHVVELLPGYPLLFSCPAGESDHVHVSDEYDWYSNGERTAVAPKETGPWTGLLVLPARLKRHTTCRCGMNAYVINDAE